MKPVNIIIALAIAFFCLPVFGQSPVQEYIANYVSGSSTVSSYTSYPTNPGSFSSCSSNQYTQTWSNGTNNLLEISSFNANSKTYVIFDLDSPFIRLRRVNNAAVSGIRNILYAEATVSPTTSCPIPRQLDFKTPYTDDMAVFLNNRLLNQGTDNLFTNTGNSDGNNNNIERVDVIFKNGISASLIDEAGFLFCERGNILAHDGFRIAPILSLDVNDDPASFGAVKTCVKGNGISNGSWGHPSLISGNKLLSVYVLRKDAADTYLRVSANVNQEIGGVFFSLTDLGIAASQVFYGYSLIGPDGTANPTSAQLLSINDASVYPTSTTEAQGGGIDLVAINTFFATDQILALDIRTTISARKQGNKVFLEWEISNLNDEATITLERSLDAISYSDIFSYKIKNDGKNFFSDDPLPDVYYYRLKIKTKAGKIRFSRVVMVNLAKHVGWKAFPSFIHSGENITMEGLPDGVYEVQINSMNSLMKRITVKIERGRGTVQLTATQWPPGIYILSVNKNGEWIGDGKKIMFLNK